MRVSRRRGRLRLRLDPAETAILADLLDELSVAVKSEDADDPVVARLFPSAYPEDGDAEVEYRSLTESALRAERLDRIAAMAGDVSSGGDIDLGDADTARRWIQTLNDLRLALGTRLHVTEEEPRFDPTDPEQRPRVVYYWLTALQDSIVTSLLD